MSARLVVFAAALTGACGAVQAAPDLIWPVCNRFGMVRLPEQGMQAQGVWWSDPAKKIYLDYGTPVYAAGNGVVLSAEKMSRFGLVIDVAHTEGIFTRYGHLQSVTVHAGERVFQGQRIATVGSSGWSAKPGLYLAVHDNAVLFEPDTLMRNPPCKGDVIAVPPPELRGTVRR